MTDAPSPRCSSGTSNLLPCPFCGGKGAITLGMVREVKIVDVICQDCGGAMPAFCEEDAIADWNARPGGVAQAAPVPSDEDWNIRKYIDFLRADEGDSITLLCDNPDFNGQPNCAIECNGYWTNWQDRRFAADTLQGALELAYFECREWRANPPPEVSPDPLPAYADPNFKYDMETGTYRRIAEASPVSSTSGGTAA